MHRRAGRRVVALAAALVLTACSSSALTGRGSGRTGASSGTSSAAPATTTASSSAGPGASTPKTSTAAPSPGPSSSSAGGLCANRSTAQEVAACLRDAIGTFWSGELNEVVSEPVYLLAGPAQVPPACRPGLSGAPAFTCRSNLTLYINRQLLDIIAKDIPAADERYALASVQSHEIGHVLQYRLRQPQIETSHPTAAQTKYVEQQADCLSGVWAHHAAQTGGFDGATFYRIAVELVTLVSSNAEIQTHGTPAQRAAAIRRGLASGRPQSCQLVTFS